MENRHPETVEQWLAIATFGLVPSARERIKLEIQAHYADLVAERLVDGMTQKDAKSAALLELGEPSSAAKEFRKNHLTEDERRHLNEWVESSRKSVSSDRWFVLFLFGPSIALQIWIFAMSDKMPSTANWAGLSWCIGCLIVFTVINLMSRRLFKRQLPAREFVRQFLRLQSWGTISQLIMIVTTITTGQPKAQYWVSIVSISFGLAIWLQHKRALFRKLGKHGAPDSFEMAAS
jgi:hypothetical protein